MSDDYGEVRSQGETLRERAIDLEVEHQAMIAYSQVEDEYDWTHEEKLQRLALYSDEYRAEIASWFADLTEIFDELAQLPDPAAFRAQAGELTTALTNLSGPSGHTDVANGAEYGPHPSYEHLNHIPTYLVDWNGIAADNFKSNFVPAFERVVHHEFEAVVSLRSALEAQATLWEKARLDVSNLIDETNSALDDYDGGKDSADTVLALSIIGAIVAVAAVPFTGGTSAALYWAMAGSTIAVTGAVVGYPQEPKKELDISGDSPAAIINSMREAVWDLKMQWLNVEIFIVEQVRHLSDRINGYTAPEGASPVPRGYPHYSTEHSYDQETVHEFTMPRPTIADSTPANVTDDDHLGEPAA